MPRAIVFDPEEYDLRSFVVQALCDNDITRITLRNILFIRLVIESANLITIEYSVEEKQHTKKLRVQA